MMQGPTLVVYVEDLMHAHTKVTDLQHHQEWKDTGFVHSGAYICSMAEALAEVMPYTWVHS